MFWGRRKRIKSVQHQKKEHFSESEKSTTCSFSFIFLLSKRRQQKQKAEGREFFSSFFLRFFFDALLSLLSLSSFLSLLFSLFSLKQLVCVFAREFSPHLITFWRRLKLQSSS